MELKENTSIVVLGASGDLAKKKTVWSFPGGGGTRHSASFLLVFKHPPRPFFSPGPLRPPNSISLTRSLRI